MATLDDVRRFFAEEVRVVGNVGSAPLIEAFATVPRERFLGPGPWRIAYPDPTRPGSVNYVATPDDDPRHLCHNVLVGIDPERELNNGHPSSLAAWLDALALRAGDRVVHVGCGVGYYTAIMAQVVGRSGSVLAVEVDPALAARAREALRAEAQVRVVEGDGVAIEFGIADVIFANAGLTHPPVHWLDRLAPGGRMLLPITMTAPAAPGGAPAPAASVGFMLLVERTPTGDDARFLSPVSIFASVGGRDPDVNAKLRAAVMGGRWHAVRRLRRDAHPPGDRCWLHGDGWCLTMGDTP